MEQLMTAEKMFSKSIEECNPIERSIIQDYNCKVNGSPDYIEYRTRLLNILATQYKKKWNKEPKEILIG